MKQINQTDKKHCENCGEQIFGRADKRFCDTYCKNTFNSNRRKAERFQEYDNLPEIFKIIRNNHEILKAYNPEELSTNATFSISRAELVDKGFNFRFFTSVERDSSVVTGNSVLIMDGRKMDLNTAALPIISMHSI